MKNLTLTEFNALSLDAQVLADDEFGKKVLLLNDQSIIKLFRVKRFISQATLYSPARRFAKNAKKLQALDIPTISLIELYNIDSIKRTAVHYHQLEGLMVREYLQTHPIEDSFLSALGKFIAQLHSKGIFFRSAHFGNIIYTPEKTFGLIDISDMSISTSSLSIAKRLRNLKHIFRITEDINFIQHSQAIEHGYLQACQLENNLFFNFFKRRFLQITQELKKNVSSDKQLSI